MTKTFNAPATLEPPDTDRVTKTVDQSEEQKQSLQQKTTRKTSIVENSNTTDLPLQAPTPRDHGGTRVAQLEAEVAELRRKLERAETKLVGYSCGRSLMM